MENSLRTSNEKIAHYLKSKLENARKEFATLDEPAPIFVELQKKLDEFDVEAYKTKVSKEIAENLVAYWTNPSEGIDPDEKILSILFEYDNCFDEEVEAFAYGIVDWEDFAPQTAIFDMGNNYDFAKEFYAMPGIHLDFFGALESINWANQSKYEEEHGEPLNELDGYEEILALYLATGLVALNEAFTELDKKGVFKKINSAESFMFMIGEHDFGGVYPIYTI